MKKYLTSVLIASLLVLSCAKDEEIIPPPISGEIVGSWKWVKTCGGISGTCGYPTIDTRKVILFSDSVFTGKVWTSDDQTVTYKVINKSIQDESTFYIIELNDGTTWEAGINSNYLYFQFGSINEWYQRVK